MGVVNGVELCGGECRMEWSYVGVNGVELFGGGEWSGAMWG